jgi:hypothetical protein
MSLSSISRRPVTTNGLLFSWGKRALSVIFLFVLFCTFLVSNASAQAGPSAPAAGSSAGGTSAGAAFKYLGVNMHSLQVHDDGTLNSVFGYLSKCGVNTVRTFGLSERGGTGSVNRVAAVAGQHGIKLVVALADFANGSSQMSGANQDPTGYFGGGYNTQGYTAYAQQAATAFNGNPNIAVVELANEPHCVGRADCLDPYVNWATRIAGILGGKSYGVSLGSMVIKLGYGDEPGVGFGRSNAAPGMTQGSGHFYPEVEPDKRGLLVQAAQEAEGLGKEMMMGEIGFKCNSDPCTNSSNDEERAEKIIEEMQYFSENGYDGFLYWQFSGFKSSPLENDVFSWFASGPDDIDNPICKALREGTVTPKGPKPDPTFIYPRNVTEIEKYLANSQVYCANRFELRPDYKGEAPPLTPARDENEEIGIGMPIEPSKFQLGDGAANPYEYTINEVTELTRYGNASVSGGMSFPLFRNSAGGISIESDLSEINPNETWFQALKRQDKPKTAPQFFLTSPTTQCLNIVHQIKYVQQACTQFSKKPVTECAANTSITLPAGSGPSKKLLEFASLFPDESVCNTIGDDIEQDNERAKALRSISPSTPKLYKMAFIVQHTHFHHDDYFQSTLYMLQQIASWFGIGGPQSSPFYGEKLDVVPIWYHAGIAVDQFDEYIDPATGVIRPYAFDPITLTGKDKASERPEQKNFLGPWTNTYEALMAPQFQDAIAEKRMRTVYENWQLLQQAKNQWSKTSVNYTIDNETVVDGAAAAIECSGVKNGAEGDACLCFKEDNDLCPNQSAEEVMQAFPADFEPENPGAFAKDLKKLLIARVKSGIQRSNRFVDGLPNETLSRRVWDKCLPHPEGEGVQEAVTNLGSNVMQNPKNPIEKISNFFYSKVVNDSRLVDQHPVLRQNTQTFVILPDEALTIEVAQAYIAPMFLSPEMYNNIMTGKTELLPVDELAKTQKREPFLSAFLRTIGVTRSLSTSQEGYIKVAPTYYAYQPSCVTPDCGCSPINMTQTGRGPEEWISIETYEELEESSPSCDSLTITKYEKVADSTNEVKHQYELKNPTPNPETPGQFAAFNEFLRRLAFTPSHLHNYVTYPGLEAFYRGEGQSQDFTSSAGKNEAGGDVPSACVYAQPRTITPSEDGYNTLQDLRPLVCEQASRVGIPAELLRALLEVEGSPLLRAVRNQSSYVCKPNSAGAVGPMGILVTQCTTQDYGFQTDANNLTHDWCTPRGALVGGANVAKGKVNEVRSVTPGINIDSPDGYERVADLYLGRGSCKSFDDDFDGLAKPLAGDPRDYCAYIRDVTLLFKGQNYCGGN